MGITIVSLSKKIHNRASFTNQHSSLQNYIRNNVTRDIEKGMAQCYILTEDDISVKGYYTLSSISIPGHDWGEDFLKKNKLNYGVIPCTLLGKLAVDSTSQGKRYGEILLIDALKNALIQSKKIGSFAVVVDPIDQKAKDFYLKYDFVELSNTQRMYLSMRKIQALSI